MEQTSDIRHSRLIPSEVFAVPIGKVYLLYAPLHHLSAIINQSALFEIKYCIQSGNSAVNELKSVISAITLPPERTPQPRTGEIDNPYFLGLLPTRGCNMACKYCDFLSGETQVMSFDIARRSVDGYLDILRRNDRQSGAIHFFGGEPFHAPQMVQFTIEYARIQVAKLGIALHFEATTNGNYDDTLARWIANNLDTVVLSLDGMADAQNTHRPLKGGSPSFERVSNSASIFSDSNCDLIIRSCVSNLNVDRLPEIANWFIQSYRPTAVCFEPLSESAATRRNHLFPPDPLTYARKFHVAARDLQQFDVPTYLSTADLSQNRVTSCPVGNDALIVSPEGTVNTCYLLENEWQEAGLNMKLGKVTENGFDIDTEAVDRIRQISVYRKTLCENCFCRFTCAGGCHVHHKTNQPPGKYDDQCIRTRLVTASLLLDELDRQLCDEWLTNDNLANRTSLNISDRIMDYAQ